MTDPRQPELFTTGPAAPVDTAPEAAGLSAVASRLPARLRMGTSSWTFPGWAGLVYDRDASPATLATHGLAAYAGHPLLRCVGLDRTYYGPVPPAALRHYRDQTPRDFRFVVKADRRLLFPGGPGSDPDAFMNPSWARDHVVGPLAEGLGEKLSAILFQFPPMAAEVTGGPRGFAERLYRFLEAVPAAAPRVVEIRTAAFLNRDYAQALHHSGSRHGYVVHPEMPDLETQTGVVPPDDAGLTVLRWMLQPGYRYPEAREAWAPFATLQAPDPASRSGVAALVRRSLAAGGETMVVVNNKAEGSSPLSVEALARALAGGPEATS